MIFGQLLDMPQPMIEGKSPECIQKTMVASLATDQNTASKESLEVRT